MTSLSSLPPKQVLAQLLMERARRQKIRTEQVLRKAGSDVVAKQVPSLVLDRASVFSDLIYRRARYKVYWGGRGSAKSWSVAEALIRIAARHKVGVLCVREFQNSIKDSSHKILTRTIERLGLGAFFHVTREEIKSRTGAFFIFKGMHGKDSSIRSTEGIDICWVEEAQTMSAASWSALTPTIRETGSEIWVTYNLINEEDPTHDRFVNHTPTDAIVHKVNYDANPHFLGSPLHQEMLDDRERDYHLYEHVWLGMPLVISDAIIFSGKYVVEEFPDDLWLRADRLHFGADWGFAQDPSVLLREFILDNKLYIEYEAYETGVELSDYHEFFSRVPGSRDWPIKADSARPETISHIRNEWGYNIQAAEKWDGSVKDGIAHIRKFNQVVIHPRCTNTAREARLYRYKTDKLTGEVLPVIIDKNNHTWDASRYGLDGHIQRSGSLGQWQRLGEAPPQQAGV